MLTLILLGRYLVQDVRNLPKVALFINSVKTNSVRTGINYETSLSYFQSFLTTKGYTLESVLEPVSNNKLNVYVLLEEFISFLPKSLQPNSVRQYMIGIKSYLAYYDIDVIPAKFKRKVHMPKIQTDDQDPLDVADVRNILLKCSNRRLKTLILILASAGMRISELLSTRICDCDFTMSPTKIHIRKEIAKTRVARQVYISDEASKSLSEWIEWKYRYRKNLGKHQHIKNDNDLIFQVAPTIVGIQSMYVKLLKEFDKVLTLAGLNGKEEGMNRRKITMHSFRRLVKTVISTQVNTDYSEYFLGHKKSPYWSMKESERREIYVRKCMPHLTFLDYTALETTGKNIESKLEQKDAQIAELNKRLEMLKADTIGRLEELELMSKGVVKHVRKQIGNRL